MKNRRFKSVRFKILYTSIIGIIVFILIFVSSYTALTRKIFNDVLYESQMNYVQLYALITANWLEERMSEVETYARNSIVRSMDKLQTNDLLVKEMASKSSIYQIIFVSDKEGNYHSNLNLEAGNLNVREYFHRVMDGESVIEGPLISMSTGKRIIVVAAPIKNEEDMVIGVMGGTVELETIASYITTYNSFIHSSDTYILDSSGLVIAHPDSQLSMKENIGVPSIHISSDLNQVADEILTNREGVVEYKRAGINQIAYFHKIPYINDWTVVTEIPAKYITYPINQLSFLLAGVGVFVFFLGIIISIIVSRKNSKPIIQLKQAFDRATAGDMSVRANIQSNDELGEAGRSFNIMMDKLSQLTYYDPITNLPNLNALQDHINIVMLNAEKEKNAVFLMVSIDQFESLSQQYEAVLLERIQKEITRRLRILTSLYARLFKSNSDDFILFLDNIKSRARVIEIANKIIEIIANPLNTVRGQIHITCSIGVAYIPSDGKDFEAILKCAGIAKTRSKQLGGNQYQFYNEEMNKGLSEEFSLVKDMHTALSNNEFFLEYQPFMDVRTGKIVQSEALIRWLHPEKGLLYPNRFIELAEKNNLIVPIGNWVLKEACRQNKAWQDLGHEPIVVSVNISVLQFERSEFVQIVKDTLKDVGLSPKYLELEITESMAMRNIDIFKQKMNELRSLGVKISIDDFGTGFSSLNYLVQLPIDVLKIDRSFIKEIETSEYAKIIISTIISIGKVLKMDIVAEGVETLEQFEFIKKAQCSKVQGFFISRPINTSSFEKLLRANGFLIEQVAENA